MIWRLVLLLGILPVSVGAQLTRIERERALIMVDVVRDDVIRNYFDSTFGGLDIKSVFDTARARVQRAERIEQVFGAIAVATLALRDNHTAFIPPGLVYRAEYGWDMRFIGDTCRVLDVKAGSDAAAKGLRVGDAVLAVNGVPLTPENLGQLKYSIHALQPRTSLRATVRSPGPDSTTRTLEISSKVTQRRRLLDPSSSLDLWEIIREGENRWEEKVPRYAVLDDRVLLWSLREFHDDREWIDDLTRRLRNREGLVLDLRGNPGGAVSSLLRLIGLFYEANLQVAVEVGRKGLTEMIAQGSGKGRFEGPVVVLVDAESGSASEIFARTLQRTGRGKVVGDQTAGAVRKSMTFVHAVGSQTAAYYGASVTIADIMMPDGALLENAGVTPDIMLLPTGEDLAAGADPALSHALGLLGVTRSPKAAGEMGLLR